MAELSKTPEEIKKGLGCAVDSVVGCFLTKCPYKYGPCTPDSGAELRKDALALVQQLEAENAELKRERDAAIYDLERYSMCKPCKHLIAEDGQCSFTNDCAYGTKGCFEWRGPCEENGGN